MKNLKPFVIGYLLFLILGLVIVEFTAKGDFLLFLNSYQSAILDYVFYYLTKAVEIPVILFISLIFLWNHSKFSIQFGLVGLSTLCLSLILKDVFLHPRPISFLMSESMSDSFNPILILKPHEGLTSFPSGHSMAAFAFMLTIALICNKKWISTLSIIIAISVGISRIYLLNHYLEDVLAGSLLGVYLALLVDKIMSYVSIPSFKELILKT